MGVWTECLHLEDDIVAGGVPLGKDAVGPTPRRYHIARMVSGQLPPFLQPRGYAHFDRASMPAFALRYVSDPQSIATHASWPFLQFTKKSPRYGRDPATGKRTFLRVKSRIPQGSPISAVLANLYMPRSDTRRYDRLTKMEATYRRYSDDILVISPPGEAVHAEEVVIDELRRVGLTIQSQKTVRVAFRMAGRKQKAFRLPPQEP